MNAALSKLLSKAKLLNDLSVTLDVLTLQVSKHVTTLTNHLQKSSSGVMIMGMILKMLIQIVDPCCQDSYLYFR